MLTITAGANYPLNMVNTNTSAWGLPEFVTVENGSELQALSSTGYTVTFYGSFTIGTSLTGSVTDFRISYGPSLVLDLSGFNVTIAQLEAIDNGSSTIAAFTNSLLNGQGAVIIGSSGDDVLDGTPFADTFKPNGGVDAVVGDGGGDTVVYTGALSDYSFSLSSVTVGSTSYPVIYVTDNRANSPDGTDGLAQISYLKFSTGTIAAATVTSATGIKPTRLQLLNASDIFRTSDPLGFSAVKIQFEDLTTASNSGYLMLNGVQQAAGLIINATPQDDVTFQTQSGTDQVKMRVFNGYEWGAWTTATVAAPVNRPTVVTAAATSTVLPGTTVSLSTLFSTSDRDGDIVVKYQFEDISGPGHLTIDGNVPGKGVNLGAVLPGDLGNVSVTTGTGSEVVAVRAYDGFDWGVWTNVTIVGGYTAPTVALANSTAVAAAHLQSFGFNDLFSATDSQGLAITKYDLMDVDVTAGGGMIEVNGVVQAANTDIVVNTADLSSLSFVASGTDIIYGRVYNGHSWSARQKITITGPIDHAPVVALSTLATPRLGTTVTLGSLISSTDSDSDATTEYRIYDATPGGGTLKLGSVSQGNNSVYIAPGDLGNLTFIAGTSDTLEIRAFDGLNWSAWKSLTVTSGNLLPVVTRTVSATISASHLQSFGFSDLFSTSDPQGSNIVKYDFYDGTVGGGAIQLGGVTQAALTDIVVNATALSSLSFVASGTDALYARVWDGYSWSARVKVTITAPTGSSRLAFDPNGPLRYGVDDNAFYAPGLITSTVSTHTASGTTVQVGDIFTINGDQPTLYQIQDKTTGRGTLMLGGIAQGSKLITIAASDLSLVTFKTGTGTDDLYIRAYNGLSWGPATDFDIKGLAAAAPVSSAPILPTLALPVTSSLAAAVASPLSATVDPLTKTNWGFASAS